MIDPTKVTVIALTGERGVGKDFLVHELKKTAAINQSDLKINRLSFSDEVRKCAYAAFPDLKKYEDQDVKNDPIRGMPWNPFEKSWRECIKKVSTAYRDIDPAFFVRTFKKNQFDSLKEPGLYIITDLRTPDEYAFLIAAGIPIFKIAANTGFDPDEFEEFVRSLSERNVSAVIFNDYTAEFPQKALAQIQGTLSERSQCYKQSDFGKVVASQFQVNRTYGGADWMEQNRQHKFQTAADVEFYEFLNEIQEIWKFWKYDAEAIKNEPWLVNDAALTEFSDWVCFMTSVFIFIDDGRNIRLTEPYDHPLYAESKQYTQADWLEKVYPLQAKIRNQSGFKEHFLFFIDATLRIILRMGYRSSVFNDKMKETHLRNIRRCTDVTNDLDILDQKIFKAFDTEPTPLTMIGRL